MKNILIKSFLLLILSAFLFYACDKQNISNDPSHKLEFSMDTVMFDTVFTTVGSVSQALKVYNRHNEDLIISDIFVATAEQSQYNINLDGQSGHEFKEIELLANDSLYVFIKVTVDPTNQNSPAIVTDSIFFVTNGNIQDVDLVACGQDAHFILPDHHDDETDFHYSIVAGEGESVVWEDDKPYVIYGYAVVDSLGALEIGPGTNLHFHKNSGLWVYTGGALNVNGLQDSVVTFQGDRLGYYYSENPGQWNGIFINESDHVHTIKYAIIKNAVTGIQARRLELVEPEFGSNLILENVRVYNSSYSALFSIAFNVYAYNSVFANSAVYNGFLSTAGFFDFRHCTFANYWNYTGRQDPSLVISNHIIFTSSQGGDSIIAGNVEAKIANSIIYGSQDDEFALAEVEGAELIAEFDHCLFKTTQDLNEDHFINCISYQDSLFVNYTANNYHLDTISNPAVNAGNPEVLNNPYNFDLDFDLDGNSRTNDEAPDLGAYEFIDD